MRTFTIGGKHISLYPSAAPGRPVLYLNLFADMGDAVRAALTQAGCPEHTLVVISALDWEHDMAPWDAPAAFRGGAPCTGGADEYLRLLTGAIVPRVEREIPGPVAWRGLAGYSLSGLFALYALCRCDLFSRAASMSGSLWFPGIRAYLFSHPLRQTPAHLYFSLGEKESCTRNPLLQPVRQNTEQIAAFYRSQGFDTALVFHPGNHTHHAVERTAAGIAWLLSR